LAAAPIAIALVAAFIAVLDNTAFWNMALHATTLDEHQFAILVSLFAVIFCTTVVMLALAAGRWTLKVTGAVLLLVAAVCGYFMSEYGVIIDLSMIRNIAETESQEAGPLLTAELFRHVALFGALPAAILLAVRLPKISWRRSFVARACLVTVSALALVLTLYVNYGPVSFFAREHHPVRFFFNPGYPIYSLGRYLLRADDHPPVARAPLAAGVAASHLARPKRTLLVFVVGETARADRFALNGYARDTNHYTRPRNLVNFPNVTSCGTSTADSVPCIFSGLGREGFTHAAAAAHESLFGAIGRLGAGVFWRDNSTGCKDVCDPEHFEEYAARTDPDFCDSTGCFDEILLDDIDKLVEDPSRDHFIVLHQRGSHGPAYHTDTPKWSKEFFPECDLANLRNCDLDSVNNAYDNTIVYSDYFLARVIDFLDEQSDRFDVAMLYASDHGESLGENGLYLHGFPYAVAPQEQIRVPMVFWASDSFYSHNGIDAGCVPSTADGDVSHDWIFHTLVPLFGLETASYREDLDLLAACRRDSAGFAGAAASASGSGG
jgi:lipid A ethanolaminephosphotransferase